MAESIPDGEILVTGAAGFVGANMVRRLVREGLRPCALLRASSDTWRLQSVLRDVTVVQGDLEDADAMADAARTIAPAAIVHCATYGIYHDQQDRRRMMRTSVEGLVNLLDAFPGAYVVNVGSSSEYGPSPEPLSEEAPLLPAIAYGVAKAAASLYALYASEQRAVAVVRPFAAYGPWEDPRRLVPTVVSACLQGRDPELSSPDAVRDFVFIEDLLDAILLLVRRRACGAFNVGSGVQRSVADLTACVIALTGARVTPRWGKPARPDRVEPAAWRADARKIAALGWTPRHDLDAGLAATIAWAREEGAWRTS